MNFAQYFPSGQFVLIVGSIALAGGLVLTAQYVTHPFPHVASIITEATPGNKQSSAPWQQTLKEIQAQSGITLPSAPDPDAYTKLLAGAESSNLTETIGKTLFIQVTNAKAQGLGDDIPTQDTLISQALAKIDQTRTSAQYTSSNLTLVVNTTSSQHAYGNAFMEVLLRHPKASIKDTLVAIGTATDNNDASALAPLAQIGKEYKAISDDLAKISVPQNLAPLHLQIVNNYAQIADTYPNMATVIDDPLRGLAGIQLYQSLTQETGRLLTNIADQFSKNGILFSKDEPGSNWSLVVSQSQ